MELWYCPSLWLILHGWSPPIVSHGSPDLMRKKISGSGKGSPQVSELFSNTIQYHFCSVLVKENPRPDPLQRVKMISFISQWKEWQDPLGRAMGTEDIVHQRVLVRLSTCYGSPGWRATLTPVSWSSQSTHVPSHSTNNLYTPTQCMQLGVSYIQRSSHRREC